MEAAMYDRKKNIYEIDQAIEAGQRALAALKKAEDSLDSARGFGIWDILGGGFISGILKHSDLDDAMQYMEDAKHELQRFKSELADIHISYDVSLNFDGFTRFADFFLDGIFVDFLIQSRIKESYEEVAKIKAQVQTALSKLRRLRKVEEDQL
jgi:hypothetical protein